MQDDLQYQRQGYFANHGPAWQRPGELAAELCFLIDARTYKAGREGRQDVWFRVGTLESLAQELNMPNDSFSSIEQAFRQIKDSSWLESMGPGRVEVVEAKAPFSAIIMPGETFPDGVKADAVFVLFAESYLKYLELGEKIFGSL